METGSHSGTKWVSCWTFTWQVLFFVCMLLTTDGQIRYSVPEEMKRGSFVGNVAQDLGLDLSRLRSGRARIVTGENNQYTELKADKGLLVVKERIDREEICGDVSPCSFSFEIILENPIELHRVTVEILDVNDHSPAFKNNVVNLEISESATIGSHFDLDSAYDPDAGINTLQQYTLSPNDHFALKQHSNADGIKFAVMILQKPLDRELNPNLYLKLIAVDGGTPQRSGTVNIQIKVLDVNDNPPVFNQSLYTATVIENAPIGTYITTVNASDADSGSNGAVTYSLSIGTGKSNEKFEINSSTGKITVRDKIDFEKDRKYEIRVIAKDQGSLSDASKVVIDVVDINDNAPVINIMSFSSLVSEDVPPGTTIAVFNVKDADSERNGQITCSIEQRLPFKIYSSLTNYYNLLSDAAFDRELKAEYNITVTATDSGSPPLSAETTLHVRISDINDNAPLFTKPSYSAYITENNAPGISISHVSAQDADWSQNARISYFLDDAQVDGVLVSSFLSINSESGVIQATRSFDYEQIKQLVFSVKAQDGGSPPLSSNVTVKILIQDQNDNPPQVLYPVQSGGSMVAEMVPRSADVGYLVTKVVAVDVDSGQNAWLSYKLQKATDRALFEVGLQNGEIRTIRQVSDKDAVKQRLSVIVEDNGQPSRSATVIVNVAVADSFPEVLSEFTDFAHDKEYNDNLTFYLVLALAVVSFLFITCLVVIISVKIYRWRQSRILYHSSLPVIPYYPPRYSDTLGTGTLQHVYNYEVCRTTDSRKSDCKFGRAASQNVLIMDPSSTGTMQRIQSEKSILDEPDSPLEVRAFTCFLLLISSMRKGLR
ncbi:protocadherin beta-16-like [Takifugu flavidus]|uniref:protocadherin beta-16-like n=1 Tax=Takifugu flavidus TaxID=433684 RepID=UPI002544442B|nr:protocadherin beta-16-like [Takifugu flavidus]